jgi:hypothetical protein
MCKIGLFAVAAALFATSFGIWAASISVPDSPEQGSIFILDGITS